MVKLKPMHSFQVSTQESTLMLMLSVNGPLGLAPKGNPGSTTANVIYAFALFISESNPGFASAS